MKRILQVLLLAGGAALCVSGCASSGPPGPSLSTTLVFREQDYEEKGGVLPITGMLELTLEPSGAALSACRRQIFTDVSRSGSLSREQQMELVHRVEAWVAAGKSLPAPSGKFHGMITYGTHKAAWMRSDALPPELDELVRFLKTIPPTLSLDQRRK